VSHDRSGVPVGAPGTKLLPLSPNTTAPGAPQKFPANGVTGGGGGGGSTEWNGSGTRSLAHAEASDAPTDRSGKHDSKTRPLRQVTPLERACSSMVRPAPLSTAAATAQTPGDAGDALPRTPQILGAVSGRERHGIFDRRRSVGG
jgi:hypothetical protein